MEIMRGIKIMRGIVLLGLLAPTALGESCMGGRCRSSGPRGGDPKYDCWAGHGDPFACSGGKAKLTGAISDPYNGKRYYNYECCDATYCSPSRCTSPDGRGTTDCWAAKENREEYTCSQGTPYLTGQTARSEDGRTWNEYTCCTNAPESAAPTPERDVRACTSTQDCRDNFVNCEEATMTSCHQERDAYNGNCYTGYTDFRCAGVPNGETPESIKGVKHAGSDRRNSGVWCWDGRIDRQCIQLKGATAAQAVVPPPDSTGLIIGIIFGVLALLLIGIIFGAILAFLIRRKKQRLQQLKPSSTPWGTPAPLVGTPAAMSRPAIPFTPDKGVLRQLMQYRQEHGLPCFCYPCGQTLNYEDLLCGTCGSPANLQAAGAIPMAVPIAPQVE